MSVLAIPMRVTDNDSYQLAQLCLDAERIEEELTFDFSGTNRFGPLGLAMVASSIAVRTDKGRVTKLIAPNDAESNAFLDEVGFDVFMAGHDARPGTLDLRQMKALHATYTQQSSGSACRTCPRRDYGRERLSTDIETYF